MARLTKTFTVCTAAALLAASAAAFADDAAYADSLSTTPSAGAMAVDLVLVRPLGLVATVAGVGLFVAQLPLSLFTWNLHDPAERLIVEPARFTFARDLGSMD